MPGQTGCAYGCARGRPPCALDKDQGNEWLVKPFLDARDDADELCSRVVAHDEREAVPLAACEVNARVVAAGSTVIVRPTGGPASPSPLRRTKASVQVLAAPFAKDTALNSTTESHERL